MIPRKLMVGRELNETISMVNC